MNTTIKAQVSRIFKIIKLWVFSLFLIKILISLPFLATFLGPEFILNIQEYLRVSEQLLYTAKAIIFEEPVNFFKNFVLELKNTESQIIIEHQKEELLVIESKLKIIEEKLTQYEVSNALEKKTTNESLTINKGQRFLTIMSIVFTLTKFTYNLYKFFSSENNNDISFSIQDRETLKDTYSIVKNGIEPHINPNDPVFKTPCSLDDLGRIVDGEDFSS